MVYAPLASPFSIKRIIATSMKVSLVWALRSLIMAQPPVRWQPSEAHLHHLPAFYYRTEAGCEKAPVCGLNRKNLERAGSGGTRTRTGDP